MCHVLIIEDEALFALDLQGLLAAHGATSFDVAETEQEAVDAAMAHRPDIITSDVRLRAGSGPRAVEAIHLALGPVPVVFITSSPEACRPCDQSRILAKPVNEAAIVHAFHELAPA